MSILEHPLIVPCVRRTPLALALAALAAAPLVIHDAYILRILVLVGIYVLLTSSLNLVNGYTGLFSLGHAAFYGVGAYTSAILVTRTGCSVWVGMPAAALAAAAVAWLIAKPTLKLKGVYLTLTTLGLNIIIMLVFLNWVELTKGPLGIAGIPVPTLFGRKLTAPADYYYLILVLDVLVIFALSRLVSSRFGRALKAIREDERAAHACGIPWPTSRPSPSCSAPPWRASPVLSMHTTCATSPRTPSATQRPSTSSPCWPSAAPATCWDPSSVRPS